LLNKTKILGSVLLGSILWANQVLACGIRSASYYSNYYEGRRTANGEIFRQSGYTAAANGIRFGTWVTVTDLSTGRSVRVRINDRCGACGIDLSRQAASDLGMIQRGRINVRLDY